MISLYKDPKGEKIFSKVYGGNGDHTLMTIGSGPDNGAAVNVIAMRSKVIELEAELVVARVSGGVVCGCMFVCVHVYMCVYTTSTLSHLCMCVCVSPPPPPPPPNFLILFLFSCCIF